LESPEERFACYEAQVDAARAEQRAAPITAQPPRATVEPQSRSEPSEPGGRTTTSTARGVESSQEFVGTVTALRETVPNSFVITLDSGQVWRQTHPKSYRLRPGQKVRIYQSKNWGKPFRLEAADLNGFIQVERVQ
jgi:hypothetical protein